MTIKNRQINTSEKFSPKKNKISIYFKEDITLAGIEFKANEPKKVTRNELKDILQEASKRNKSKGNISLDEI